MNIMELGAIGELVGGVAVIGSLVYVAIQIRQGNALSRAGTFHQTNSQFSAVFSQLATDAQLAEIYQRALAGEDLSPVEVIRFTAYLATFFAFLEDVHIQTERGLFDVELPEADAVSLLAPHVQKLLHNAFGRRWWQEEACHLFSTSFYRAIAGLLPPSTGVPREV